MTTKNDNDLSNEIRAWLDGNPDAVRIREGGGPEDLAMSFAVTIAKMNRKDKPSGKIRTYTQESPILPPISFSSTTPLSSRLRAGVECAPWVIEAVIKLEQATQSRRSTDDFECAVCRDRGLFDINGEGPFDCYECGKKAPSHGPAERCDSMIRELSEMADLVSLHEGEVTAQDKESLAHLLHRAALVIHDQSPRIEVRAAGDVEVKWSDELAALAVKMDSLRHLSTGSARFTYERAVIVLESLVEIERAREQVHGQ